MSSPRPRDLAAAAQTSPSAQLTDSLGVLVIDDEPAIRTLIQLGLQEHGLAVWTASGGREGVQVYRANQKKIGVVLLDVKMPDLDGPGTLPLLQDVNPAVCCCFVTGDSGIYDEEELLRLGAARVLRKPFSLSHLSQLLGEMLSRLAEKGTAERRSAARSACEGECAWFLHAESPRPRKARIQNVSTGGISLLLERPLEPGVMLNLELHPGERRSLSVRVIHVQQRAAGEEWLVGCAFTDRLAHSELEALLEEATA